jgi:hypothetical protein
MTKTCSNCKTDNPDNSAFCQKCGQTLEDTNNPIKTNSTKGDGISGFWNKQSKNGKIALGVGICCVGLIIIIAIAGMMAPDNNTGTSTSDNSTSTPSTTNTSTPATTDTSTPASTTSSPTKTTISALMGTSIPDGTNVQVSGTVLQSGDGFLIIYDTNDNDLYVNLDDSNTKTAYENQVVTVVGTTEGPYDYTTVTGADRNIPSIGSAIVQ